jgi:hypothetical protein
LRDGLIKGLTTTTMTDKNSWEGLQRCEIEGCEGVGVVELSLEYSRGIFNAELCQDSLSCREHAEFIIEETEDYENVEIQTESFKHFRGIKKDLMRRELLSDEANIRVPKGTDPLDVIDPEKTEKEVIQASGRGGQYLLQLFESEKYANRVSGNNGAVPNNDVLSCTEYIDTVYWRSPTVRLYNLGKLRLHPEKRYKRHRSDSP